MKKIKGRIIRNIWTIFEKEEKKKVRNQGKKEINDTLFKD